MSMYTDAMKAKGTADALDLRERAAGMDPAHAQQGDPDPTRAGRFGVRHQWDLGMHRHRHVRQSPCRTGAHHHQ